LNSPLAEEVTKTVVRAVKGELPVAELLKRRPKVRAGKQAVFEPRASFDNTAATSATLIELVAQDRPGLLCDVATAVSKRARNIEVVLVHTEGNRAIDVLYVTKDGAKLEDEDTKELAATIAAAARPA
jgi:[protein-PII] uridylyltransferase